MTDEDLKLPEDGEHPAYNYIKQRFEPAKGLEDAKYLLSTSEVCRQLCMHTGNPFLKDGAIYLLLQELGYKELTLSEVMTIVWLIKDAEW